MSLGFCIYDLNVSVANALSVFIQISDHLGLTNERVLIEAVEVEGKEGEENKWLRWVKAFPLGPLDTIDSLLSELPSFGFSVTSGDPLTGVLSNSVPYVSYSRIKHLDSMYVFSPGHADLRDFAQRFLGRVPGQYGFGTNWSGSRKFFDYAYGFGDFTPVGSKPPEPVPGKISIYDLDSELFDHGYLRGIYPINLLTTAHLNRETRDGTVRDLILAHKEWGEISTLADNWFMWWVPSDEVDNVRREFESRALLGKI